MKVCATGLGHFPKIVSTPIYGKTFINLLSGTNMLFVLELWDLGCRTNQFCSNDDPRLLLTY